MSIKRDDGTSLSPVLQISYTSLTTDVNLTVELVAGPRFTMKTVT
jgi:hypothetical protein